MGIMGSIMADTETITASEAPAGSGAAVDRHVSHRGGALVAWVLAGVLVVLGVPQLIAALITLDARQTLDAVHAGAEVDPARLVDAADAFGTAAGWFGSGELELNRGLLLVRAALEGTPEERERRLDAAEQATVSGLALSPGQPVPWLRLAWLRERRGDRAGAVDAFRMSVLTGPFEPTLMKQRIEMGLRLHAALTPEALNLLKRQIQLTWIVDPTFVYDFLGRRADAAVVREALDGLTEADIERFVNAHGRVPAEPAPAP